MPELLPPPLRVLALSTVLALVAAAGTYVLLADDRRQPAEPSVELTPEAEVPTFDEATFTTFDGEEVPLTSVRGTPTVVNFFSSTCAPCVTEMPAFEEAAPGAGRPGRLPGPGRGRPAGGCPGLVDQTGVTYHTAQDPMAR